MSGRTSGHRWHAAAVGAAIVLALGAAWPAPISQPDLGPTPGTPRSTFEAPVAGEPSTDAPSSSGSPPRRGSPDPSLEVATIGPPASAASLPRRAASAVPIEEDPQVVMADVLASVARATAAALPWLHLGGRSGDEVRHRRDASQADADAETALRLRAAMGNRESGDAGGRHGPGSAVQVNLLEEALGVARDFMAEPLTWMLGVPLLLAVFMISVLRGRGK